MNYKFIIPLAMILVATIFFIFFAYSPLINQAGTLIAAVLGLVFFIGLFVVILKYNRG